jgi:NADH:quinone reductase (non-electrogenic)
MSQSVFSNAVTELFGTRLPIVAGGLMWLANADYVAAASRAGIIGFITAASFPEPHALRTEIRRCRDLSEGGPFGVNVSMLPKLVPGEKTREVFELVVDEGVKFVETSGRNPEEFMPLLKQAGVKVLHKVPSVRFAVKAASIGVDAVAMVGAECGGHPGLDMVGSFVNAAWAESQLDIPYLIGGGVGRGSQLAAALAMGASGVVVGTRFVVAEEIWAHADYKRRLVEAGPTDTDLCMQSVRNTEPGGDHSGSDADGRREDRPQCVRHGRLVEGTARCRTVAGVRRPHRTACRHREPLRERHAAGAGAGGDRLIGAR